MSLFGTREDPRDPKRIATARARVPVTFRATAIAKHFGDTVALRDVDIRGSSGELVAVHGANGSGKSTLLRIIAGVTAPSNGQVSWTSDGGDGRIRIALLGHACHLFDELTVAENVTLAARLTGRDQAGAEVYLGRLGLSGLASRRARGLSAGTRRRLGLARVLATEPDVLIVDEPFVGLDETAADLVRDVLDDERRRRLVIVATHDASSGITADRSISLDRGPVRSVRSGTPVAAAVAT